MSQFAFSCLISCIGNLIIGLFVFFKNTKSKVNRTWMLFTLSIVIWTYGQFMESIVTSEKAAIFWNKFDLVGVIFIPVFFMHFMSSLQNLYFKKKKIIFVCYIISFIFILLLFGNKFIKGVVNKPPFGFYSDPTIYFYLYFAFFSVCVVYAYYFTFRNYRTVFKIKKLQLKYTIIGTLIGFLCGTFNFLPAFNVPTTPYFNYIFAVYPLVIAYAIIRYRLMDISMVITRTGIFVATYSIILGLPFLAAILYRPYLIGFLGEQWWLAPMGLLTVLATAGPFIYIYINKKAEDRLLREQRQYQSTLRQASSGMIRIRELRKLLDLTVRIVTKTVKIEFASIFLLDAQGKHYILSSERTAVANVQKQAAIFYDEEDIEKIDKEMLKTHVGPAKLSLNAPLVRNLLSSKKDALVYEELQLQSQDNPNNKEIIELEKNIKDLQAAVIVPSYVGSKLLGFIVLGKKISQKLYSQDDLNVFSVLANQAALAIENAQFYEDIKNTNEQLFQAEKMATIGTMADGLSHQINNRFQALSLIAGDSMDIMKTTDISNCSPEVKESYEQLKHAFERIQANVMQGGEVVRGLLKYSRPGETKFESLDFNVVLDASFDMVQYKVKLSELDIVRDIPKDLPKLTCNLIQLQEVFFNLIDNAYDAIRERKASLKEPDYKGKLTIQAMTSNQHIRIIFQDNGMGVKDQDKERLFTPFFTTKATMKKGTGLGLYVIQKIISFHSGTIDISSDYKVGTKFEIVLPISKKS